MKKVEILKKANTLFESRDHKESVQHFKEVIAIDKNCLGGDDYGRLGSALLALGNRDEAVD